MAPLTYKPRPKMHPWAPPTPPSPRRYRFYLWATLGWLAATGLGYFWLAREPVGADVTSELDEANADPAGGTREAVARTDLASGELGRRSASGAEAARDLATRDSTARDSTARDSTARDSTARDSAAATMAPAAGSATASAARDERPNVAAPITACEEFVQGASESGDSRLPLHLGRSAIDVFIGENDWARPCRTSHRRSLALCVAIRDGSVVGLTAKTSPPNLTLENCLREQAAKLSLPPEPVLRVVRTTLHL